MSRCFCARCRAVAEERVAYCLACGQMGSYVPQVWLAEHPPAALRVRTARQLAYARQRTRDVLALGAMPVDEPVLAAIYGPPGSGKSSLMLRIARHVADAGATVVYVSAEEGFAATVAQRLRLVELCSDTVLVVEACTRASLLALAEERGAAWAMLDSYSTATWTVPDLVAVRRAGISLVYSLHVTKDGDAAGEMAVAHEADVIVRCDAGSWTQTKNRYGALAGGRIFEEEVAHDRTH